VSVNLNGASEKEALSAYRKKFIAGATATVLALGALVGFAGPANASGAAPVFTNVSTSATAERGTAADVYTATATDADNDPITFSINYQTDSNSDPVTGFTIGSTDGVVRMEAGVLADVYNLNIEATDGVFNAYQLITVTVSEPSTPNSAPAFATDTATATAERGTAADVYTATATDADVGDTLAYSLASPVTGFTVRSTDGVVRMEADVAAGTYVLTIEVSDGSLTDSLEVTITVEDTTAPTLTAVSVTGTTQTGTSFKFTPSEAGTYFFLVYAATDTAPSAATIRAQGTAVTKRTAAATATAMTVSITGLTAATSYKIYLVVEDAASNISTVSTTSVTTSAASSGGGGSGGGGAIVDAPTMKKHTLAFGINSAKTNKEIRASVRRILAGSPDATSVVCRPVISATNKSAAAKKLARDRSKAVCDYINRLTPVIEVRVAKAYLVVDNSKQRRTVRITIG
jgi:hypothetical protein